MKFFRFPALMAAAALLLWSVGQSTAQTPSNQNPGYQGKTQHQGDMQRTETQRTEVRHSGMQNRTDTAEGTTKCVPSKKLVGANVENKNGDKLGSIDDVVIDVNDGKVMYAALGVGGVLGVGEKLFAIPFEELKISHDSSDNPYFVLDISKEKLEKAPGFDKSNWPDFANPQWRNDVGNYYRHSSASTSQGERTTADNNR